MPVNSVTGGSNTAGVNNAISQATGNQDLGETAFLKLLTTQLSNQDPLAPQDQSQMLAQLAQFSTVEGVNNLAASQSHTQAAALLGKTVDAKIVTNGVQQAVSGQVTGVSFDTQGVHLSLQGVKDSITLDQISQIRN